MGFYNSTFFGKKTTKQQQQENPPKPKQTELHDIQVELLQVWLIGQTEKKCLLQHYCTCVQWWLNSTKTLHAPSRTK